MKAKVASCKGDLVRAVSVLIHRVGPLLFLESILTPLRSRVKGTNVRFACIHAGRSDRSDGLEESTHLHFIEASAPAGDVRSTLDTVKSRSAKKKTKKTAHSLARKDRSRAKKSAVSRSAKPRWVGTIHELAEELNLGRSRIFQLRHEPDPLPQVKPGRYDIPVCFRWYVRYLQRKIVQRAFPEDADGDSPAKSAGVTRHKLLSIEAELKQIELAEKREQLISIEKATKDIEAIVVEIRTRILALPPRLAAEVLGETDLAVSQVKIERSLKSALAALSQFDPDEALEPAPSPRSTTQ